MTRGRRKSAAASPYLERQISQIAPRLILAVGRIAAQNLLGVDTPLGKLRGTVYHYGSGGIPVVVTYHPAYLLRSPSQKRKVWEDLLLAQQLLQDFSSMIAAVKDLGPTVREMQYGDVHEYRRD